MNDGLWKDDQRWCFLPSEAFGILLMTWLLDGFILFYDGARWSGRIVFTLHDAQ